MKTRILAPLRAVAWVGRRSLATALLSLGLFTGCAREIASPEIEIIVGEDFAPAVGSRSPIGCEIRNAPPGAYVEWTAENGRFEPANSELTTYAPYKATTSVPIKVSLLSEGGGVIASDVEYVKVHPGNTGSDRVNSPVHPAVSPVRPTSPELPEHPVPETPPGDEAVPVESGSDSYLITDFFRSMAVFGGFYTKGEASCLPEIVPDEENPYLRSPYDVSNRGSYAGLWIKGTRLEAIERFGSDWDALEFSIRGGIEFPKDLKVEIKSESFGWKIIYLSEIKAEVTATWQKIFIPARSFRDFEDHIGPPEIVFTFESDEIDAPKGVIELDDIRLTKEPANAGDHPTPSPR